MRVLQIMTSKVKGGAEFYACDVAIQLHRAGIEQCVVMREDAPRFGELARLGLRMAPSPLRVPFAPAQRYLLRRLAERERPTIVQTWMRRAASLAPYGVAPVIGWLGGYLDPRTFLKCDWFVGVTPGLTQHVTKLGFPPDRTECIPTFPALEPMLAADRAALQTPRDAKVLLTLSRLHQEKGLDVLLHALTGLPDCILWLAGDGPSQGQLERLAHELGIADRVRFLGWRTDRFALLQAADVCVLPSRNEGFGTVILEAWATQTPIVACSAPGPAGLVRNRITGMLAPIEDVAGLREALREVLADEELRRTLIRQGYDAYLSGFTPEAVTRRWLDFYDAVARHSSAEIPGTRKSAA